MEVVRLSEAKPYQAPKHVDVATLRLQGYEASGAESFSVGLSYYLPGGRAELDATPLEKVYVVLDGEITVTTGEGSWTLGPLDSCRLAPNEARAVENRGNRLATMLVILPYPPSAS
jgi:quercetin dioxygenase-like cupin family protein